MHIELPDKLYYTIGEVAQAFEVNTSLIRFWEKEFSAIKPKKNNKGNRLFTVKDIQTIDRIYELVKVEGRTLDGARKALRDKTESVQEEKTEDVSSVGPSKDFNEVSAGINSQGKNERPKVI